MEKIKMGVLALLLAIGLAIGFSGGHEAEAQTGMEDPGSTMGEIPISFSQAITQGTTALVVSSVTGRAHNIRAIVITNSASGFVRLYSTSDNSNGANLMGSWGVVANTPLVLTAAALRGGVPGRVSDAVYVDAATGTVSLQMCVREDLKSVKR